MTSTSPMAAMVWKEFRENLKWAALGFLATSGTLLYILWNHATRNQAFGGDYVGTGSPLVNDEFQAATTICSGVVALLLALAQILPEKRPDQWAFLIHRPVSRTRLFLYKAIAGVILYLLAVGVPFACAVAWVAKPGNVPAPFVAGLIQPGLADLLAGLMYYFAGMVVGLREARWYGSRVMAAGIAVFCSFLVVVAPEFWLALIAIAAGVGILATAAWGNFIASGHYDRQPWPAKATLGVAVFAGIVLVGGVGVAVLGNLLFHQSNSGYYSEYSTYFVDDDGVIVRTNIRQNQIVSITDPAGNPIPKYAEVEDPYALQQMGGGIPSAGLWLDPDMRFGRILSAYRRSDRHFIDLSAPTHEKWYYLRDQRYVVGYEPKYRRLVGYAGPGGFSGTDVGPPAQRFDGKMLPDWSWPQYLLSFSTAAYQVDYVLKNVSVLFTPPAGEELVSISYAQTSPTDNTSPVQLFSAFATTKSIHVRTPDGKPLFSTPIEREPADGYNMVTVYHGGTPERNMLWYGRQHRDAASLKQSQFVTELSPTGQVLSRQEVPTIYLYQGAARPGESAFIGAAVPATGLFIAACVQSQEEGKSFGTLLEDPDLRSSFAATTVSGLVCAVITVLLARRYAFSRRRLLGWTIANLLLGPAGVLTLLSMASWHAREKCPSCGRKRVVDRERCPNCGGDFALPPLDGTEIFAA